MAVDRHAGGVRPARREHVEHRDHQLTEHRIEGGILEPETDDAAHVLRCPLALRPARTGPACGEANTARTRPPWGLSARQRGRVSKTPGSRGTACRQPGPNRPRSFTEMKRSLTR